MAEITSNGTSQASSFLFLTNRKFYQWRNKDYDDLVQQLALDNNSPLGSWSKPKILYTHTKILVKDPKHTHLKEIMKYKTSVLTPAYFFTTRILGIFSLI